MEPDRGVVDRVVLAQPVHIRDNPLAQNIGKALFKSRNQTGDITFKVDGKEIKAHKCVLAALSPKYMAQLYGDFDDAKNDSLEINDVSAAAFEEFLQFFYLNKIKLSHDNIADVLTLTADVEEFFNECINFLYASLNVKTVVQTYHLAVKHNREKLMDSCERKISLYTNEVFLSVGFLNCTASDLFNILQSDSMNVKETTVFEACIRWAKCNCEESDPNDVGNLRRILTTGNLPGELLYQIRFGAMTIEEFMSLYATYKELFTDSERDEILFMIGKVSNSKPKRFSDEPRDGPYKKWDENDSVECNRIFAEISSERFHFGVNKTTFSVDRMILLGGFYCGSLFEKTVGANCVKTIATSISVVRKHRPLDLDGTVLLKSTENLTFECKREAYVKLDRAVMLKPYVFYEIQLDFKEGFSLKHYEWKREVVLGKTIETVESIFARRSFGSSNDKKELEYIPQTLTTVTFTESDGLVTCLKLNISV